MYNQLWLIIIIISHLSLFSLSRVSQYNQETAALHTLLEKMKGELEQYRVQVTALLQDSETKDRQIQLLQDRLSEERRRGGGGEVRAIWEIIDVHCSGTSL